jgi:hypothetical protein
MVLLYMVTWIPSISPIYAILWDIIKSCVFFYEKNTIRFSRPLRLEPNGCMCLFDQLILGPW